MNTFPALTELSGSNASQADLCNQLDCKTQGQPWLPQEFASLNQTWKRTDEEQEPAALPKCPKSMVAKPLGPGMDAGQKLPRAKMACWYPCKTHFRGGEAHLFS